MEREEAINHVISSARYWAGDTIDNSYYLNNLGLEQALHAAIVHVRNSHHYNLNKFDIDEVKEILGF